MSVSEHCDSPAHSTTCMLDDTIDTSRFLLESMVELLAVNWPKNYSFFCHTCRTQYHPVQQPSLDVQTLAFTAYLYNVHKTDLCSPNSSSLQSRGVLDPEDALDEVG